MVLVDCLGEVGLGHLDQCICVYSLLVYGKGVVEHVVGSLPISPSRNCSSICRTKYISSRTCSRFAGVIWRRTSWPASRSLSAVTP